MRITILGAGPAGLYCGLLLKKANPAHDIRIVERNAPDATYGWGVVFSDRTLAAFQEADFKSYKAITDRFVLWDAIDTYYRGELIRCGGHVFAGLARKTLLAILQERCRELGVEVQFNTEVPSLKSLDEADLIIAADGVNSLARRAYESVFKPSLTPGRARYIWLGTDKVLDAFTFIFKESEHGLFQVHSYPFDGTTSTFIVECAEDVWRRAGLDTASEAESIAFCERLFADELRGCRLLPNNSKWINFVTVKCATWHTGKLVLLGDSAHTAHFSIGSGTKLAMEDAIALANAIDQYPDLERALTEYEQVRRPVVELFQAAAAESQAYFENVRRFTSLPPLQFTFNLLTRSKRITYDDLRLRDPRFVEAVDRFTDALAFRPVHAPSKQGPLAVVAPAPVLTELSLGSARLPTRVAISYGVAASSDDLPRFFPLVFASESGLRGVGLALIGLVAVSAEAKITPVCAGMYTNAQADFVTKALALARRGTNAAAAALLNHAGRRGAVQAHRQHGYHPDSPLREGAWQLVSASPIPYTRRSQTPRELDRAGMDRVRDDFVQSAKSATECGFDMLLLHMAHGYLLASFLSPLSNKRTDEYGGPLENRMRFPLEVFEAARAVWPREKPLGVALNCHDGVRGGFTLDDAVIVARALKERGCDLIQVLAGQTVPDAELPYGKAFLTPLSERVRNEVGIPTLVGGYVTTTNEANTILAGGRADIVLMTPGDYVMPGLAHRDLVRLARTPVSAAPSTDGDGRVVYTTNEPTGRAIKSEADSAATRG